MSDPNAIYKAGFQALADKLGRIPTSRDEGWLALHNEYSRSYGEERDMRLAEERKARAAGPGEEGFSRQPAPQAYSYLPRGGVQAAGEPLSGPGRAAINPGGESEPKPPVAPPGDSQGMIVGQRGASGGIVSECRQCGGMFERPAKKGRPPVKCERCR